MRSPRASSDGPSQGAVFTVRLPLAPAPSHVEGDESGGEDAATELHGGGRILVVEDNADGAATMRMLLQSHGYQVETALDGASGLSVAEKFGPDVVLLDIGLPDMDGEEVARTPFYIDLVRDQPKPGG